VAVEPIEKAHPVHRIEVASPTEERNRLHLDEDAGILAVIVLGIEFGPQVLGDLSPPDMTRHRGSMRGVYEKGKTHFLPSLHPKVKYLQLNMSSCMYLTEQSLLVRQWGSES